jgi:hypothetical protein
VEGVAGAAVCAVTFALIVLNAAAVAAVPNNTERRLKSAMTFPRDDVSVAGLVGHPIIEAKNRRRGA